MKTVFTGWRNITPGECITCGANDDWDCDGRGHIYCGCQCCYSCGSPEGHWADCKTDEEEADNAD